MKYMKMMNKNKYNNNNNNNRAPGNKGNPGKSGNDQLDLASLSEQQINELLAQGITLDQLIEIANEKGPPLPPILEAMMQQKLSPEAVSPGQMMAPAAPDQPQNQPVNNQESNIPLKSKKFPAMMDLKTYNEYQDVITEEDKEKIQKHSPNVYGYTFSPLISQSLMDDMKRTQGSFFVGVNISNLLNTFRDMVVDSEKKAYKPKNTKMLKSNPDSIFNKIGEWVDVDFSKILDTKMGFRGSEIPLLPEKRLTDYSTFYEILSESKKYSDRGFNGKITPFGLLIMTRMLYKYRNSNAQWYRVATVLELIYKYLGHGMSREQYFKNNNEIKIMSLMELEEFYNTDHIFMSQNELKKFKEDLDFYKYDQNMNVKQEIQKLQKKVQPPI